MCLTWYCCGLVKGIKRGEIDIELLSQVSTDETPSHSHVYYLDTTKKGTSKDSAWLVDAGTLGTKTTNIPRTTEAVGGNQPHENLPPCIAAYGWHRTA